MKSKFLTGLIIFTLLLNYGSAVLAQVSYGGSPLSFSFKSVDEIAGVETEAFDVQAMLVEDEANKGKAIPLRFGREFEVNYNMQNSGTLQTLADGSKLWRLKVKSEGAYSLGLIFGTYVLPEGAKMFIYSSDKKTVRGSFTSENNLKSKKLPTAQIPGEEVIVEYYEPKGVVFEGKLQVDMIIHDYKNMFGFKPEKGAGDGASLPCNVNIICPAAEDWQDEKHAVCKISMGGSVCSGAMINNTAYDGTPYFLTAEHCLRTQAAAEGLVFYFNYEAIRCEDVTALDNQTLSGADLIAVTAEELLDFTLVKMSKTPPENYKPYVCGWNRSTKPALNVTGIHHPAGDMKKFSHDNDRPVTGDFYMYRDNSHWLVSDFEVGTAQGGSSGSPMYDENHRIVGNLSAGPKEEGCDGVGNLYQKFDLAWDLYTEPGEQVGFWLDPLKTGQITTDGFYIYGADVDAQLASVVKPSTSLFCQTDGKLTPQVIVYNRGNSDMTSLNVVYTIDGGTPISYSWTGKVAIDKSVEILLPETTLENGTHEIKIYTSNPNGKLDGNNYNDTSAFSFEVDRAAAEVSFQITTDLSGDETTWEIKDKDGNLLFSGGPYEKNIQKTYKYSFCMTDGAEYSFKIFDSAGNGIKSNGFGFWSLHHGYQMDAPVAGSSFTDVYEYVFIAEGVSQIAKEELQISIFPNPTKGKIYFESLENKISSIEISDITGKIVKKEIVNSLKSQTDISSLQNGIYLVKIETEKGNVFEKIFLNK